MGLVTSKEIAESIKADKFGFLGTFWDGFLCNYSE